MCQYGRNRDWEVSRRDCFLGRAAWSVCSLESNQLTIAMVKRLDEEQSRSFIKRGWTRKGGINRLSNHVTFSQGGV